MQQYNDSFKKISNRLVVIDNLHGDVADVLKNSSCLITDYSSVANDFAYMNKPLAYYQADFKKFYKYHLPTGYWDYKEDGFGPVCYTSKEVVLWLDKCISAGFKPEPIYESRATDFFEFNDQKNCERNFTAIKNLLDRG